jgi:hypothetical protein
MHRSKLVLSLLATVALALAAGQSNAGNTVPAYTFNNLFQLTVPSGYGIQSIRGITADGKQVVGIETLNMSGFTYAAVWNNPTSLAVTLNQSQSSGALATNGTLQVGAANNGPPNEEHPVVWSGSASSAVFLNPAGYLGSANGVAGDQVVGFVSMPQTLQNHAQLWTGSNYSAVDLQPSNQAYYGSDALATDGVRQVGYAQTMIGANGTTHAMIWSGTASSAVDLNPTTTTFSQALGISGAQQVGIGLFGGEYHAMLWTGTASSAVDLGTGAYASSEAVATNGTYQIGYANQGYVTLTADHAMIWAGTASSAFDLSSLIPGGATTSQALSIDAKGDVFGYAFENSKLYAVEWVATPEPSSVFLLSLGALGLGATALGRKMRARLAEGGAPV